MTDPLDDQVIAKAEIHRAIFGPVLFLAIMWAILIGGMIGIQALIFHFVSNTFGKIDSQVGFRPWIALFAFIPAVPVLGGVFGIIWFAYKSSELVLTARRIKFRTGYFSRHSGELPLENVESIMISEGILGRRFGYGTIRLTTVGGAAMPLHYIANPQTFHAKLQHAVLERKQTLRGPQQPPIAPSQSSAGLGDSRYMPKG